MGYLLLPNLIFALGLGVEPSAQAWRSLDGAVAFALCGGSHLVASAAGSLNVFDRTPFGKLDGQSFGTTIVTARRYAHDLATLPGTPDFNVASQYRGNPDCSLGRYLMNSPHGPSEIH